MKIKKSTINHWYANDHHIKQQVKECLKHYPGSKQASYNEEVNFNHLKIDETQIIIIIKHIEYSTEEQIFINSYKRVA